MDAALDIIDTWLAPVGGLAAGLTALVAAFALVHLLIVPILLWRAARWSKRSARELAALNAMLRAGRGRRERPEEAIGRSIRERELEIETRRVEPPVPAPIRPGSTANGANAADPARERRGLPKWRAYGFDPDSGLKTSVVVRATSIAAAKDEAKIRGVRSVSLVERLGESD